MPLRSTNTMQEALQRMLGSLAEMKVLPDADLEWIINLETQIVAKLREPIDKLAQAGLTNAPSQQGFPGPMPSITPQGAGAGAAGLRTEPGMPNPDELRRLIAGGV